MAITKADILEAVNDNLEREETTIDRQIKRVLFKVSTAGNFLAAIKSTDTIDEDTTIIDYPTDFKTLDNIRLEDEENERFTNYLTNISYTEYLSALFANSKSVPNEFAIWNKQIYFFPTPSKEFTVHLSYFKIHPADPDNIEFEDRFQSVMESGTTYEVARRFGLTEQVNMWGSMYADDLNDVIKYQMKPIYTTKFSRW